ncbi:Universal stress protein F [Raoultella ornithinolytica]|nr:Universal stress protein F [Raoultella ornithinolytica]
MARIILVPIDISEKELTQRVVCHVEAEARIDDAEVHFLTVIPSLPYYASLGMAYTTELPPMDEFKAESETRLKEFVAQFAIPEDRVHFHVKEGSPKDNILELAKTLPADLVIIASHRPDITTYLLGSNAAAVVRHCRLFRTGCALTPSARPHGRAFYLNICQVKLPEMC